MPEEDAAQAPEAVFQRPPLLLPPSLLPPTPLEPIPPSRPPPVPPLVLPLMPMMPLPWKLPARGSLAAANTRRRAPR